MPTWDSLMLTTWRRVLLAMALISDVLPVPGGPCSNTPSFFGEPLTANRPVPAWNASRSDSNSSFSGKKSESNVFDAARR